MAKGEWRISGVRMKKSYFERAIATAAVVLVVVIIIVAAGAGAYIVLNQTSTTTTSTSQATSSSVSSVSISAVTSTTTNTTSSSSITTSSSSTTTSSSTSSSPTSSTSTVVSTSTSKTTSFATTSSTDTTTACQTSTTSNTAGSNISTPLLDLFGNFTHMSVTETVVTNSSSTVNENASFTIVGRPMINGSQYYEVNFTQYLVESQVTSNQSGTIWFLPDGNATELTVGPTKYTGAYANLEAEVVMIPYNLVVQAGYGFVAGLSNSTQYTEINQTTTTVSSVQMNQTDYQGSLASLNNDSSCTGLTYTDLVVGMAFVPNTNFAIALLIYSVFTESGTTTAFTIDVDSFTLS